MYRGLGAVDYTGSSWCGSGNPLIDFFCPAADKRSISEQIITDPSDYGAQLSEANRLKAEQMARETIAADDPCNYSEINSMGWGEKLVCSGKESLLGRGNQVDFTPVAIVIAGIAAFMLIKG